MKIPFTLPLPKAGDPISAAGWTQLVAAVRFILGLDVVAPLRINRGPHGPSIRIDAQTAGASAPLIRRPWWPEPDPSNPGAWRFINCFFNAGVHMYGPGTVSNVQLFPGGGTVCVWVAFDLQTKLSNIQSAASFPSQQTGGSRTLMRRHSIWNGGAMTDCRVGGGGV